MDDCELGSGDVGIFTGPYWKLVLESGISKIYGYMTGRVFNVLWYDDDHGDNSTCVCRSHLKHT